MWSSPESAEQPMPFNVRRPSSKFSRPTGSRPPAHAGGLLPSTVGSCGVLCERTPRFVPDDLRAPALWCSHAGACWRQQVSFVETADGRAGVDTPSATSSPATACVRCSERADDASLSRRCHRDAGSRSISSRSPRRQCAEPAVVHQGSRELRLSAIVLVAILPRTGL